MQQPIKLPKWPTSLSKERGFFCACNYNRIQKYLILLFCLISFHWRQKGCLIHFWVSLIAIKTLASVSWMISIGDNQTAFHAMLKFNGHLSFSFSTIFTIFATQTFRNFILNSYFTHNYAKRDVMAEPNYTLFRWTRFSFFSKSTFINKHRVSASIANFLLTNNEISCLRVISRSVPKNVTIGLLVWKGTRNGLNSEARYLKKWNLTSTNWFEWYLTKVTKDLLIWGVYLSARITSVSQPRQCLTIFE